MVWLVNRPSESPHLFSRRLARQILTGQYAKRRTLGTAHALNQTLRRAVAHHRAGRLHDAERLYRAILKVLPRHAETNHNLGILLLKSQQADPALSYLKAAVTADPAQTQYWLSYIDALLKLKQPEKARQVIDLGRKVGLTESAENAIASRLVEPQPMAPDDDTLSSVVALFKQGRYAEMENLAQALTVRFPHHGFGWKALGAARDQLGRLAESLSPLQVAAQLVPNDVEAHTNLGDTLRRMGKLAEAERSLRRALAIDHEYPEALNNLGITLKDQGRLAEAEILLRRAVAASPAMSAAYSNLGATLSETGNLQEAEYHLRHATQLNPRFAEAHNNLGNLLQAQGRLIEAEVSIRRSLEIMPTFALAHSNLGKVLQDQGRLIEAEASTRRAIDIKPDFAEAHSNLGNILQGQGRLQESAANLMHALRLNPNFTAAHSNLVFSLAYDVKVSPARCLDEALRFSRKAEEKARAYSGWDYVRTPRRLRVGLVSGDLYNHPVGYFLESLLKNVDSTRLELVAYSTHSKEDALTSRIRPYFDAWRPLAAINDEAAARLIHSDGIHILLDLSGHTAHNRLPVFAWKPAPVQASWLGYFATTGLAAIDYLLADEVSVPMAHATHFTEKIWYLPDTRLCFTPPDIDLPVAPPPALSSGHITFGCFQTLAKLSDEVLDVWALILAARPHARLRWQARQLGDTALATRMIERLARHGIAPNRVELHGGECREAYLASHAEVDLILDTFPYPGGTTTCEAMWMGVPTLTLAGDRMISRQGASLLSAAGLANWVASSVADYVARALCFADDLSTLSALRGKMRSQVLASPVCDAARFARRFEEAMWDMWRRRQP